MAKLIVIEGTDASGKETQTEILCDRLRSEGYKVKQISFPNYTSPASEPLKMYLNGDFGKCTGEEDIVAVSSMYAIDRYASFKSDWEDNYINEDEIIIADRYTQSNMIHQSSKFKSKQVRNNYCEWLLQYESSMGLPSADKVIFLNMHPSIAEVLIDKRNNKINNSDKKDIHESDMEHITNAYYTGRELVNDQKWDEIVCGEVREDNSYSIKSIDEISEEIYNNVMSVIKGSDR